MRIAAKVIIVIERGLDMLQRWELKRVVPGTVPSRLQRAVDFVRLPRITTVRCWYRYWVGWRRLCRAIVMRDGRQCNKRDLLLQEVCRGILMLHLGDRGLATSGLILSIGRRGIGIVLLAGDRIAHAPQLPSAGHADTPCQRGFVP